MCSICLSSPKENKSNGSIRYEHQGWGHPEYKPNPNPGFGAVIDVHSPIATARTDRLLTAMIGLSKARSAANEVNAIRLENGKVSEFPIPVFRIATICAFRI